MSDNKSSNPKKATDNDPTDEDLESINQTFKLYANGSSYVREKKPKNEDEPVKFINSELKDSINKIQTTVKKEKVDQLLKNSKERGLELFGADANQLSEEEKSKLLKKLGKWESTEEINVANASVMVAWMEKFGKSK